MLTIITVNPGTLAAHHKHFSEHRQEAILAELLAKVSDIILMYMSELISPEWLSKLHEKDYMHFLQYAYESFKQAGNTDWTDVTGGLIPQQFTRMKPNICQVPLYKHAGYFTSDTMTPIYEHTYVNAMKSAHHAYYAAELLAQSKTKQVIYVLATSPGHHAKYDEYGGYCFINNAAVAAYRLTELGRRKVGVLDLDYHMGNGLCDMIMKNVYFADKICACSIHCDPELDYPAFDHYADGLIANYPLKGLTDWTIYEKTLRSACEQLLAWKIDTLIIAFGADTFKLDPDPSPLGQFKLNIEHYELMGKVIRSYFPHMSILVTQEGGYDLHWVPVIVREFLQSLLKF